MGRRALLGLLAAGALDSQAKAWARPSAALKGDEVPSQRFSAGRLKQSACRWPYRAIPLPNLCRAAAGMGLAGIDLLGADEWERGRESGLVCSMGYPTARRGFLPTRVKRPADHPKPFPGVRKENPET